MSEFDNTHPLDEGLDLTSTFGSYAAALTQAIREAKPSTLYGLIIVSSDTPPTSGDDAWRKRCLWLKHDVAPMKLYYYNNISWELLQDTFEGLDIKDGAVTLAKFSPAMGAALQILRKNAGNTGFEWVDFISNFSAGMLEHSWLKTSFAGAFLKADDDGIFKPEDFEALVLELIGTTALSWAQITDSPGTAQAGQVPYFSGAGVVAKLTYIESLLRDKTTPLSKLLIPSGNAGKQFVVNTAGDGIDFAAIAAQTKIATVSDGSKVANTYGQLVAPATTAIVELTVETDPDNITSVASNRFTLGPGTYHVHIDVPISPQSSSATKYNFYLLQLYNVTAAVDTAYRTLWHDVDSDTMSGMLDVPFTLTVESQFEVRLVASSANAVSAYLGRPANIASKNEVYTIVTITKLK